MKRNRINLKTITLIFLILQNCIFTRMFLYQDNLNRKKNQIRENICENIINDTNLNIYKDSYKIRYLIFLGIPLDIATTVGIVKFVHPIAGFFYFLFGYVYFAGESFPTFHGYQIFCGSYPKPSSPRFEYYYFIRIQYNKESEEPDKCMLKENDKEKMLSAMKSELKIKKYETILDESKYEYGTIKTKADKCFYYIRIPDYNDSSN